MKDNVKNLLGNIVVPHTEVKYSRLLEQFINPFVKEFEETESDIDLLDFSINAWNYANVEVIMPIDKFEKTQSKLRDDYVDFKLLRKMIDFKIANFKEYDRFIVDYEIDEIKEGEDPILRVLTQEKEAYISNMMNTLDNEEEETDFDENYINRSAIILTAKQPFLDWYLKMYPEDLDYEDEIKKAAIYLIDDKIDDINTWLKKKFDKFFMLALEDWCTDKKKWPQNRNYKMFNLWFRADTSDLIYDLEKRPVLKSE